MIEIPCTVDASNVAPHRIAPVEGDMLGLMQRVKAAERLTIEASAHRDPSLAWRAIASHPLVDSVSVARRLFDTYRAEIPGVEAAFE